uniref:DUF3741 domain-containing protein n=1 Tax=Leersia perrieri TaxID=77586 RepID=A0A0D9UZ95_9ORYZ
MRRRGIRSFCHGVDSTSTTTQRCRLVGTDAASSTSFLTVPTASSSVAVPEEAAVTLEQMILQLDLEEAAAARNATRQQQPRRASCAGSSDEHSSRVLRSARDALSQYPRFSLDGRDAAMFPAASFSDGMGYEMDMERTLRMPATVAGESVVWCKPGVVAKLMGLDAVPVPVRRRRKAAAEGIIGGGGRKGRTEEEMEKERLFMALHGYDVAGSEYHAGGFHPGVGPYASGMGRIGDDGWDYRVPH